MGSPPGCRLPRLLPLPLLLAADEDGLAERPNLPRQAHHIHHTRVQLLPYMRQVGRLRSGGNDDCCYS